MKRVRDQRERCAVCSTLNPTELVVLDNMLADPETWPENIWGPIKPPPGLPGNYRSFGAVGTAMWWLSAHGYAIDRQSVKRHYELHVVPLPYPREREKALVPEAPIDPRRFLRYYATGVELGIKALDYLIRRFEAWETEGKEIPIAYLRLAADLGKSVSVSQASIRAAGKPLHEEDDDDDFRRAGMPAGEVPRFVGDISVHVIEGERRPVVDRGRADRLAYNERADQEGSPRLPA